MSEASLHTGNAQPQMDREEHDHPNGAEAAKRVSIRGLITPQLSTVTVSTTETPCPAVSMPNRRSIIIFNSNASLVCWIGASGLASGTGIKLDSEEKMVIDSERGLTAIAEANYVLLRILELR